MRFAYWIAALAISAASLSLALMRWLSRGGRAADRPPHHLVLIGASIGRGWNLQEWPARVGIRDFGAETVAAWQFDKTDALEEVLLRPARRFRLTRTYLKSLWLEPPRRPDIVILKECSAYFPGDLRVQEGQIREWVARLRQRGVGLMLATVVPVTRTRAARDPGKQASLIEFNRWICEYAAEQGVALLDLARVLRADGGASFLAEEFAAPDGAHLNAAAYAALDCALLAAVRGMSPAPLRLAAGDRHRGTHGSSRPSNAR